MKKLAFAIAIAMALTSPVAAQPSITILTGSTSGVYYPLGNAISAIFLKTIPGARSSVQVTQGSIENLKLLEDGDGELAFSLGDSLSAAWKGNAEAGFRRPLTKLRGIAAIYRNYVQLVVSEASGIKALADLKGKRVSVGPRQSGTELNARAIFAAAGLSYRDFSRTDYLSFGQSAKLIEKGDLDATLQSAGLGVDSIRQLGTSVAINFVEIPKDVINDAAVVPSIIPARTYEGQTKDVETAAIVNFLVTREGVSADTVYAMTRAIFSNLTQLVQTHPAASGISLKDAMVGCRCRYILAQNVTIARWGFCVERRCALAEPWCGQWVCSTGIGIPISRIIALGPGTQRENRVTADIRRDGLFYRRPSARPSVRSSEAMSAVMPRILKISGT
jgi:TRAP transporter TAXI family solute receptor